MMYDSTNIANNLHRWYTYFNAILKDDNTVIVSFVDFTLYSRVIYREISIPEFIKYKGVDVFVKSTNDMSDNITAVNVKQKHVEYFI